MRWAGQFIEEGTAGLMLGPCCWGLMMGKVTAALVLELDGPISHQVLRCSRASLLPLGPHTASTEAIRTAQLPCCHRPGSPRGLTSCSLFEPLGDTKLSVIHPILQ